MTPELLMLVDAIDDGWRWGLFAALALLAWGALVLAALFFTLAMVWIWRRVTVGSWPGAVRAIERKAFE